MRVSWLGGRDRRTQVVWVWRVLKWCLFGFLAAVAFNLVFLLAGVDAGMVQSAGGFVWLAVWGGGLIAEGRAARRRSILDTTLTHGQRNW